MLQVLGSTWALLLGMGLLMVGNGVQGTLLGVRGAIEGFSTFEMSVVMSAYFLGFLGGSRLAPELIRRVGHVRVFAALGSLISAVLLIYAVIPDWIVWTLLRVLIGFCFSGVYVTAESWLNNAASNENRGKALSLYMIVQMVGIIAAQALMNLADPAGFMLFVIPSVLVSFAFAPILLSVAPAPVFDTTKAMSLRTLYVSSPLGTVGMFLMGGVFAAFFGMASVWGTLAGLSVFEISLFVAAIFGGGLVLQYPLGWISDRMDRRKLIGIAAAVCAGVALVAFLTEPGLSGMLVIGFLIGGISNPLYALLLAHTGDFLEREDMAAASGGLLFVNGLGAVSGPLVAGWLMGVLGPEGFFLQIAVLTGLVAAYAAWRMTRRPAPTVEQTAPFTAVMPAASAVAAGAAAETGMEDTDPVPA
ncbi:MFS transporter [Rhodobaculum claviforme]|uniref:MFS transporter n=1 Tax=Rhodobaculum claviforme TaxID=1549854 RepID=A0A934WJH9_9RHOB|nr:MFS transporter [Rhodobaculum claviforme]MBK5928066.1 MFS transporter [Rhodobaculum claviforme]